MDKKTEALRLALEALESKYIVNCGAWRVQQNQAVTAIREALEQPEVWVTPKLRPLAKLAKELDGVVADVEQGDGFDDVCLDTVKYVRDELTTQPAQRQEPVIDKSAAIRIATALGWAPRREWVGLTEQEHTDIAIQCGCMSADWVFYGATVERILKEKNS